MSAPNPSTAEAIDIGRVTLERMSKVDRYNAWLYSKVADWVGETVVEVGSGTGNMSSFIEDRSRVFLTDLHPEYRRELRDRYASHPGISVCGWDLEHEAPDEIRTAKPDTVICLNVLEHVERDQLALENIYRGLAPGGRLLLMVPAMPLLYGSLDRHLDHHRRYGRRGLLRILERAGFRIETMFFMNFFGMFGWFLNSRVFRRQILSTRQLFLFNKFAPIFIAIERHLPIPAGLSLVAVGVRPE